MVNALLPAFLRDWRGYFIAEAALPARVMVFLDYQNVHLAAHQKFHPPGSPTALTHVDPLKIGKLLVSRRNEESALVGVRIYRGQPNPIFQPSSAAANERQLRVWTASRAVTVVRRQLRYPRTWPDQPAQEKGVDVALAVDFVRLALQQKYDVGILFSADTDLLPALETVVELQLARVEVAAWTKAFRLRFAGTALPWCHHLTRSDYLSVADPTNYTKVPPDRSQ